MSESLALGLRQLGGYGTENTTTTGYQYAVRNRGSDCIGCLVYHFISYIIFHIIHASNTICYMVGIHQNIVIENSGKSKRETLGGRFILATRYIPCLKRSVLYLFYAFMPAMMPVNNYVCCAHHRSMRAGRFAYPPTRTGTLYINARRSVHLRRARQRVIR